MKEFPFIEEECAANIHRKVALDVERVESVNGKNEKIKGP